MKSKPIRIGPILSCQVTHLEPLVCLNNSVRRRPSHRQPMWTISTWNGALPSWSILLHPLRKIVLIGARCEQDAAPMLELRRVGRAVVVVPALVQFAVRQIGPVEAGRVFKDNAVTRVCAIPFISDSNNVMAVSPVVFVRLDVIGIPVGL